MEYTELGKIVNTHGIKGEVRIYPYTDDMKAALKLKKIYLDSSKEEVLVRSIKVHKNMFIASLDKIDSMEKAEKLKDKMIYKESAKAEDLEEDEYYVSDLIGLEVLLENGESFGIVKDIISTGANDVYTISTKEHGEVLIPAIKDVVKKIDIKEKKIYISLMEGLI